MLFVDEEIYCYARIEDYYEIVGKNGGKMGFVIIKRFGEDAIVSGTISREDMLDCLLRNSYEKTVQEAFELGLSSPTYEEIKNDKTSPGAAFWHATDKNYERL